MNKNLIGIALLASTVLLAAHVNKPFPPHKIADNLYYVGTADYASYLVTTNHDGNILINPSFEDTVPMIQANVEKLGFRFADTKIILISHAHDDHAAGCARAKQMTGAKLMVMDADVAEIENGGAGDFQYQSRWPGAKVDRVLHDGDKVQLGGAVLTAHLTPGHTKGCTTWTMQTDQWDVVIVGSPNVNSGYKLVNNPLYPNIAADYEKTFRVLKSLPCNIFLGAHGNYYGMAAKYARLQPGAPNPFLDGAGYRSYVEERERAFQAELKKQQAAAR